MTTAARGARVCVVLKRTSWRRWVDEEQDERTHELLAAGDEVVGRMRAATALCSQLPTGSGPTFPFWA
jgi:hypothetical protein